MISPFGWCFEFIMKECVIVNTCCISAYPFNLFGMMLMSVSMVEHNVYLSDILVYIVLYILIQKKCRVLLHGASWEGYALNHEHSLQNHIRKPIGEKMG